MLVFAFIFTCISLDLTARAANQPSPKLHVLAVEIVDQQNILRLITRTRTDTSGAPVLIPNPAFCNNILTRLTVNRNHYDISLDLDNRTASERRQIVNEAFLAFLTRKEVSIHVSDRGCSSAEGRLVTGLSLY